MESITIIIWYHPPGAVVKDLLGQETYEAEGAMFKLAQARRCETRRSTPSYFVCHLMLSDQDGSPSIQKRRKFGGYIKRITSNKGLECHGKFADSITLDPVRVPTAHSIQEAPV